MPLLKLPKSSPIEVNFHVEVTPEMVKFINAVKTHCQQRKDEGYKLFAKTHGMKVINKHFASTEKGEHYSSNSLYQVIDAIYESGSGKLKKMLKDLFAESSKLEQAFHDTKKGILQQAVIGSGF